MEIVSDEEWFDVNFIKPDAKIKKVTKHKRRLTGDDKREFTIANKDKLLETMASMVEVVRKNHIAKRSFKVLRLVDINERLEYEFFRSFDYMMYLKYHSRYNRGYDGWVIEEIPYTPDTQVKTNKEMQEEFLATHQIERVESEINYTSKELQIYKSKSYVNITKDYNKNLEDIVHIYDNIRYMKPDGSIDILFTFKRNVFNSGRSAFQTIYWMVQTNNNTLKTKRLAINELNIPSFLEENGFVIYQHKVTQKYYSEAQERKYRLSGKKKQQTINGNTFTLDDDEWSEDWFSNNYPLRHK